LLQGCVHVEDSTKEYVNVMVCTVVYYLSYMNEMSPRQILVHILTSLANKYPCILVCALAKFCRNFTKVRKAVSLFATMILWHLKSSQHVCYHDSAALGQSDTCTIL